MELLAKLEKRVAGWLKDVPHLPVTGQKWLAQNIWWIAVIGLVLSSIQLLAEIVRLLNWLSVSGSYLASYYVTSGITSWAIVTSLVSLVFVAVNIILLAMAINPLRARVKKGWVLLFLTWLVSIVAVVVTSIISLSVVGVVIGLLFGLIFLAVIGYFLFEMHGQFAHQTKAAKKAK